MDAHSREIVARKLRALADRIEAGEDVGDLFGLELEDEDVDSIGGLLGKTLGQVPQPGATATVHGLVLTGGASRGRGRGIATVFVERAAEPEDVQDEGERRDD